MNEDYLLTLTKNVHLGRLSVVMNAGTVSIPRIIELKDDGTIF